MDLSTIQKTLDNSPINALGIVIFNHILSRISNPESGCAMALTTVAMSVFTVKFKLSNPGKESTKMLLCAFVNYKKKTG